MGTAYESGYRGILTSLGGVKGQLNHGRVIVNTVLAVTSNQQQLLDNNPKRISAIIQNIDPGAESIYLALGEPVVGTDGLTLGVNQSFQIDGLFPWTGAVKGTPSVAHCTCWIQEISVD